MVIKKNIAGFFQLLFLMAVKIVWKILAGWSKPPEKGQKK
jgi:hypothetical protein